MSLELAGVMILLIADLMIVAFLLGYLMTLGNRWR